jgi:DNA modification methylase
LGSLPWEEEECLEIRPIRYSDRILVPKAAPHLELRTSRDYGGTGAESPQVAALINLVHPSDNLPLLASLPAASIDLISIDPPFNSGRDHEAVNPRTGRRGSFPDRHDGLDGYLAFLRPRFAELFRILRPGGSFFCHCDWHASHYIKVLLDDLLGCAAFRNEIIWDYGGKGGARGAKAIAGQFARNHDVILYYAKDGPGRIFNRPRVERVYTLEEVRRRGFRRDDQGRWFKTAPRGDYTDDSIARLESEGRIHRTRPRCGSGPVAGSIRIKYFLEERDGHIIEEALIGDVWSDIPDAMHMGAQRCGWPTQKPLALAERIISAASNPGDLVLDAFCGSGTTLVAAARLGRRWIGIDSSAEACEIARERLRAAMQDFTTEAQRHGEEKIEGQASQGRKGRNRHRPASANETRPA